MGDTTMNNKIAFVFPGQGAQYVGMGKALYDRYDAARHVYDTCDSEKIKNLSFGTCPSGSGSKEDLLPTNVAQPAIFMADMATALSLKERGIVAQGVAGFSLGEVPALAYCGLLGMKEAYDFVCFRAEAMHKCTVAHKGGMMAVLGLPDETVEEICSNVDGAFPANYNAPGQVVVAFRSDAADTLKKAVTDGSFSSGAKGKAMPLPVAGAFHSPLMDDASTEIGAYLQNISFGEMSVPLYANVTGEIYSDPKMLLTTQVNSPVRWHVTINQMIADGFDTFIETGPGKALAGMIKKIDKNVRVYNVFDDKTLESVVKEIESQK